ncbi:MAG: TonB-dependent receptor [Pseudomonadota bacterium]
MSGLKLLLTSTVLASAMGSASLAASLAQAAPDTEDLATALNRMATEANVEILFSPELVAGRSAPSTSINGSPGVVLNQMLAGSGLSVRQSRPNVFVVTEAVSASSPGAALVQTSAVTQTSAVSQAPVQQEGAPGSVEGRLVDTLTGTGLAGAIIRLEGTNISAVTDQRGFYRMAAVPPGEYTLSADYVGAPSQSARIRVAPGSEVDQDFSVNLGERETITVFGNRSGFLQALNQQRTAENNRTVISADLLGTFPAESVAEALRRVPGVSFERDANTGEGNRVSVRGITPEAVNIQINGLQLQGTGIERAVDLTGFLADNISQITIQKSLLPENEGTANGGLIEIETRSALDYGDRYFNFGIEREFSGDSEFGDEWQLNASAVTQLNDRFGIGANIQYRTSDRRNIDMRYNDVDAPVLPVGFTSLFRVPFTFTYPFGDGLAGRLVTGTNYFVRDREVENLTGSVFAAWDVSDSTRLRFEYQRIVNDETRETARSTGLGSTLATNMPIPELGGEVRRRTYVRGLQPSMGLDEREETITTDVFSVRGDTTYNQWTLDYKVGYSSTTNEVDEFSISAISDRNSDVFNIFDPASITVNPDSGGNDRVVEGVVTTVGDGIPVLALSDLGRAFYLDPDTYFISSALRRQRENESELFTAEFDAQYDFSEAFAGVFQSVKFGMKYDDSTRNNSDDVLSQNVPTAFFYSRRFPNQQLVSSLSGDIFTPYSFGAIGAPGVTAPLFSFGSARSIFDQVEATFAADPNSYRLFDNRVDPSVSSGAISPALTDEKSFAGYVQAEIEFGDVTVTSGARFERVEATGTAISAPLYRQANSVFVDRSLLASLGLIEQFDNSGTTDKFLPSLVATYRPGENWVGRFAYNRTIFSPSLISVNRPFTVAIDQRAGRETAEIREANPGLEPETNDNFEIGLERYFGDRPAYIKGAFFYKDISGNITNVTQIAAPADVEARVLEFLAPLLQADPSLALSPNTQYLLRRPENGEGGQIYGIELEGATNLDFFPETWPAFLEDVQVLANITWTEAGFPTNITARDEDGEIISLEVERPLANQAEWAGNFSVSYESGGFSSRLLYTYQSELVRTYDEFNLNTIIPEFETVDFIASYTFERGPGLFTAFFEVDNLLNGAEDAEVILGTGSFGGDGSSGEFFYPTNLQFSGGRAFTVGLRSTF